jgi:hypothetical protein
MTIDSEDCSRRGAYQEVIKFEYRRMAILRDYNEFVGIKGNSIGGKDTEGVIESKESIMVTRHSMDIISMIASSN